MHWLTANSARGTNTHVNTNERAPVILAHATNPAPGNTSLSAAALAFCDKSYAFW
jgi:hypothetical protein